MNTTPTPHGYPPKQENIPFQHPFELVPTSSHPTRQENLHMPPNLDSRTPPNPDNRDVVPRRPDLVPSPGTTSTATSSLGPSPYGRDDVTEESKTHTHPSTSSHHKGRPQTDPDLTNAHELTTRLAGLHHTRYRVALCRDPDHPRHWTATPLITYPPPPIPSRLIPPWEEGLGRYGYTA